MKRFANLVGPALFAALLAPSAQASSVTFGNPASGESNVFPFGGFYQDSLGATEYQQVYSGSEFGGSVLINSISFYNMSGGTITNADGTYTLSLSTTTAPVDGLSSTMANNIGGDNTTFFSGSLPATVSNNGLLTFDLTTAFAFNPSGGNLLLDVQMSGVTNGSFAPYAAQDGDFGGISSRMVNGGANSTSEYGLVTTFGIGPSDVSAVPEPTTMTLAAIGSVIAASFIWRRRHDGLGVQSAPL